MAGRRQPSEVASWVNSVVPSNSYRRNRSELSDGFEPAERREESALWLSFVIAARTRPELRSRAVGLQTGLDALVRRVLIETERSGALTPGLDLELETRRLSALLDGLTLQAVQHPDLVGPDELRAVLRRHLDTLAGS